MPHLLFGIVFVVKLVEVESDTTIPALCLSDVVLLFRLNSLHQTGNIGPIETKDDGDVIKRFVGLPGQKINIDEDRGMLNPDYI